jgi:hypothetical protein
MAEVIAQTWLPLGAPVIAKLAFVADLVARAEP